jgi:hypothetical protein
MSCIIEVSYYQGEIVLCPLYPWASMPLDNDWWVTTSPVGGKDGFTYALPIVLIIVHKMVYIVWAHIANTFATNVFLVFIHLPLSYIYIYNQSRRVTTSCPHALTLEGRMVSVYDYIHTIYRGLNKVKIRTLCAYGL